MNQSQTQRILFVGVGILALLIGVGVVQEIRSNRGHEVEPRVITLTDEERATLQERLTTYRPQLDEKPGDVDLSIEVARAEHLLGNSDEAVRVLTFALEQRQESTNLRTALSSIYRDLGKAKEAMQLYEDLLAGEITISVPYVQYINLIREIDPTNQKKIEEVYELGKTKVTIDPGNLHRALVGYYTDKDAYARAIEIWEEIQTLEGENDSITNAMTELKQRLGE